jgi:hypothetical protein
MTPDEQFFATHKDRQCHIRTAQPGESEREFRALGPHDVSRRRILLWRLPADSPIGAGKVADFPMLAFGDERIEDTDAVLLPILNELMTNARAADQAAHPELYRRQ